MILEGMILLAIGGALAWLAIANWRHRREERISLAEAVILKTTGVEPLPSTGFDRALQWFQIMMASVFGPLLALIGLAMLIFGAAE